MFCLLAFIIGLRYLCCLLCGEIVSGWTSLILSIWFVGGCVMLAMVIGAYLKIYIEIKSRPRFNIKEIL